MDIARNWIPETTISCVRTASKLDCGVFSMQWNMREPTCTLMVTSGSRRINTPWGLQGHSPALRQYVLFYLANLHQSGKTEDCPSPH